MSVTVADCLALPSFRDAKVAGGAAGLNKIVASVSVMEVAEVSVLTEEVLAGNELALTAFSTAKDDVEKQCKVYRHLFDRGVTAVVLYYVGIIVPKLDKKLIAVADELSMPLIIMPPKNMRYRYSDAIHEIVEAILYDNHHDRYFVPTIIERVAQLPVSQRNLNNVLRILSDRFHLTIIVTDEHLCLMSKAVWPSTSNFDTDGFIEAVEKEITSFTSGKTIKIGDPLVSAFYSAIYVSKNQKMYVFAVFDDEDKSASDLDKNALMQIAESIQLIASMRNYSDWSLSSNQLVNAIMNNDAYRTNQIASQSGFDIKSISCMWILIVSKTTEEKIAELLTTSRMLQVKGFLSDRFKTSFVGSFEDSIVCLMSESPDPDTLESAPREIMSEIFSEGDILLLSFSNLETFMDIRKGYDASQEGWFALKSIYKSKAVFCQQELDFALSCLRRIGDKENTIRECTAILDPLAGAGNAAESLDTLSVFLLDAGSSINETAKLMHVHPNTVKYRLREIKKKLKADITKLPDAYGLYLAVALRRLNDAI